MSNIPVAINSIKQSLEDLTPELRVGFSAGTATAINLKVAETLASKTTSLTTKALIALVKTDMGSLSKVSGAVSKFLLDNLRYALAVETVRQRTKKAQTATPLENADLSLGLALTQGSGGEPEGTGILDSLMTTVDKHIEYQFLKTRLIGDKFAEVYIALVEAAMVSSVQFLQYKDLNSLQQDKIQAEIDLIQQKAVTEFAQTGKLPTAKDWTPTKESLLGKALDLSKVQIATFEEDIKQKFLSALLTAHGEYCQIESTGSGAVNIHNPENINEAIRRCSPRTADGKHIIDPDVPSGAQPNTTINDQPNIPDPT